MKNILVTGALGQIGSELVPALRGRDGNERVVASDIRMMPADTPRGDGPFEFVDCTDVKQIQEIMSPGT
jgi:nucleoside-diphosphate-sugar epimerase